jgi:hypothetical protein
MTIVFAGDVALQASSLLVGFLSIVGAAGKGAGSIFFGAAPGAAGAGAAPPQPQPQPSAPQELELQRMPLLHFTVKMAFTRSARG